MRITIDLPGSLVRELKTRAAQDGQSLESLLNELIQRAMRMHEDLRHSPRCRVTFDALVEGLQQHIG